MRYLRTAVAAALSAALMFTAAHSALADDPLILPAGLACEDFNLGISGTGGNLHTKEFLDREGNVVRTITAGKGVLLRYTNYGPDPDNPVAGASVTIRTDGSVTQIRQNPDGTQTVSATGHNGLVLFPSDIPPGPTTTQYIGRIVYTISPGRIPTIPATTSSSSSALPAASGTSAPSSANDKGPDSGEGRPPGAARLGLGGPRAPRRVQRQAQLLVLRVEPRLRALGVVAGAERHQVVRIEPRGPCGPRPSR